MLAHLLLHMTRLITQWAQLGPTWGNASSGKSEIRIRCLQCYEDGQIAIACYCCSAYTHRSDVKEARTAREGPVWCPKQFH